MDRGISKSRTDLDRSGWTYNVTQYIILEDDMIFVVPSDLGPKVKVRKLFLRNRHVWNEMSGEPFLGTPDYSF